MIARITAVIISLFLLALPLAARCDDTSLILDKLGSSRTDISYTGIQSVVSLNGDKPVVVRYRTSRYLAEMERKERLDDRNAIQEAVIDDKKALYRYIHTQKVVYKDTSNLMGLSPLKVRESIGLARKNYDIKVEGREKIANRDCVRVSFVPRKNDRPTRRMWLDAEYGLPLKTEVYDTAGKLTAVSGFSEIIFNPRFPDSYFMLMVPQNIQVIETPELPGLTLASATRLLGAPIFVPAYLPDGYALREVSLLGKDARSKVQLIYGDGLTTLSVFQAVFLDARQDARSDMADARKMTRVSLSEGKDGYFRNYGQTNTLTFENKAVRFTLIGEVNREEMLKIANSTTKRR